MINLLLSVIALLVSFYIIARIVELYFVETLEIISEKLKLSSDVAGATFMAAGSSAPELFVSILAISRVGEQQAIGAGTIVGSAIFNILVIVGASALVKRAVLTWQPVIRDLIFYIITILLLLITFSDGVINKTDAFLFVGLYIVYLASFRIWKKFFPYRLDQDLKQNKISKPEQKQKNIRKSGMNINNIFDKFLSLAFFDLTSKPKMFMVNFLISIAFLGTFSFLMVESAVYIANFIGLSEVVIGLTVLAFGTSIPDLLSSINVAKKGRGDMAVANAVGSNIFDISIGLGIPWLFVLTFRTSQIGVATENLFSSVILLFATVIALLFLLIAKKWEIGRYAGILLIAFYVFYLLTQIGILSFQLCLNAGGSYCFNL